MNVEIPKGDTAADIQQGEFLLIGCRHGSEPALEIRQKIAFPSFRKSYWRKGLVTFRVPPQTLTDSQWNDFEIPADVLDKLVFARIGIRSLGQVTGQTIEERVAATHHLLTSIHFQAVHVWKRDPRLKVDTESIHRKLTESFVSLNENLFLSTTHLILDCVIDSEDRWWIGVHNNESRAGQWPGGYYTHQIPAQKISRAWLKLDEAIARFGINFEPGERVCELGAAPGGACQRLLEADLEVVGVDPAAIDSQIAEHARFTHWKKRARDVRIRTFHGFDWILTDMNIDPASTMAALERILVSPSLRPRGIIATLKLSDVSIAEKIGQWCTSFASWGYQTQVQQLSTGGQEICLVAQKNHAQKR
ncbi:MAG: hypothetical protein HOD99_05875 [Planctomycetaceae bacterium]|nr:hypothetical protein [Planctomycetaceae bacterium]